MCKAIEEWKKDLIVEGYSKGELDGYSKGVLEGYDKGELEGYSKGELDGYNRGEHDGRNLELKKNVNTLMNNMRLSLKEALDLLNVPEEDRGLFYTTH